MCKKLFSAMLMTAMIAIVLWPAKPLGKSVPVSATLTSVVGDVQIKPKDGNWKKAKEGMTVKPGTQIKTGAKSSVVIKWSSKNVIKLTPYSNFTLKKMEIDPRNKSVETSASLTTGKIKGRAEKMRNPNSSYKISTPTAVAGVRGTTFDMGNSADNTTNITTYDGLMEATAMGRTVQIPGGMTLTINPGEAPDNPTAIEDDDAHTCVTNQDCWSGVCVDGKCVNEAASVDSTCYESGAQCINNEQCCSGECDADGLCTEIDADTLAAACVQDAGACAANAECCSEFCDNGVCAQPPEDTCLAGEQPCAEDGECCSQACEDGLCLAEEEAMAGRDMCLDGDEPCAENEECCSNVCDNGLCTTEEVALCTNDNDACATNEECCSQLCENGLCAAADDTVLSVTINEPADGEEYPLNVESFTLSGFTSPNASCNVNGTPFTADADGSFQGEVADLIEGELPINVTCMSDAGEMAEDEVTVDIIGPPLLIVTSPPEGFVSCPKVSLSGLTDPDTSVIVNEINIFENDSADVTSDGSFTYDGFHLEDCQMPLIFEAKDEYGQTTQYVVNPGTSGNLENMGVSITEIKLTLTPSGQWLYGQTEVMAKVNIKATTPIPAGLIVDLVDPDSGMFMQSAIVFPQYGVTTTDGTYYAEADAMLFAGPGVMKVQAHLGDKSSRVRSVDLKAPVCMAGAVAMTMGDGIDNDCDGLTDEEVPDGVDNDGDGLKDEDLVCDYSDPNADCDGDNVANSADCNPFDPFISSGCADTFAFAGIIPDDRIDNDGDGLVDEETMDGIDNDGDGLVDEDLSAECYFDDPFSDCDYDGVANGDDCNPYDSTITGMISLAQCGSDTSSCDPYTQPDKDCDKDGLSNAEELAVGTNPFKRDTDSDGYTDAAELNEGTDPMNPVSNPAEYLVDTDNDGYPDEVERAYGSNINDPNSTPVTVGAISAVDTDGDTYPDDIELAYGSDPYNPMSVPGNETASAGYCPGGQEFDPATGDCFCPDGTSWDPDVFACIMPDFMNCQAGMYFDDFVGACVLTCTGGQIADPNAGVCFCQTGVRNWETMTCASSCPALADGTQMVPSEWGDCVCPTDKPYWSPVRDTCVSQCLPGMVLDMGAMECRCPTGTFLDYTNGTCVTTTSGTLCPAGTMGEYCDYSVRGDCDGDGIDNVNDATPCYNDTGSALCPAESDAPSCDLMGTTILDCDYDGAQNDWDPCPCRYGTPNNDYCPTVTGCPTGMFLNPRAEACVAVCPTDMVADSTINECVCAAGTYFDYMSLQCTSSCPAGFEPITHTDGTTECGCPAATPLWDDFTGSCTIQCTGGAEPSSDYTYCECPTGQYPDYMTMSCQTQDTSYCSATPPYENNCPCTAAADCASNVCDIYSGVCVPGGNAANCNLDTFCDPSLEDSQSCSDCWCGDGICDGYESSSAMCPTDCQGSCDSTVAGGDCDGDGFLNGVDACPYDWADSMTSTDGCPSCSYTNGPCTVTADCCNAGDECVYSAAYGQMVCLYQGAGTCGDNACDYPTEDNATCPTDCLCDMDYICEPQEGAGWCPTDCAGGCGDAMCNYPTEDNATCPSDCVCNNDTICDMQEGVWCSDCAGAGCLGGAPNAVCETGEDQYNCPDDCSVGTCSSYMDSTTCAGDAMCFWNTGDAMCYENATTCDTYMAQASCDGSPTCYWNTGVCYDTTTPCSSYLDSTSCGIASMFGCSWNVSYCELGGGGSCGDYMCDTGENMDTCPTDCTTCCDIQDATDCTSDSTCDWDGTTLTCYQCGDAICGASENTMTCPGDCVSCGDIYEMTACTADTNCTWNASTCEPVGGSCNSDFTCDTGENMDTCPTDCTMCGDILDSTDCTSDSTCDWDATTVTCHQCGDSLCDASENMDTCPTDCTTCTDILDSTACDTDSACVWNVSTCEDDPCGNMTCDTGENMDTCPTDCTMCGDILDSTDCTSDSTCDWDATTVTCHQCGDSLCDASENMDTCPTDCTTCTDILDSTACGNDSSCVWNVSTCEDDPCGNMTCDTGENMDSCPTDCTACGDILDSTDCTSDSTCTWDAISSICHYCGDTVCAGAENMDNCPGDCTTCADILDDTACNNDATCTWNVSVCE